MKIAIEGIASRMQIHTTLSFTKDPLEFAVAFGESLKSLTTASEVLLMGATTTFEHSMIKLLQHARDQMLKEVDIMLPRASIAKNIELTSFQTFLFSKFGF